VGGHKANLSMALDQIAETESFVSKPWEKKKVLTLLSVFTMMKLGGAITKDKLGELHIKKG